jgi:gluconate 2-dehydrogenase gamma chain
MVFTESQQRTLEAVLNRLIPADDYPGAWEAGVGDYIARQLEGDSRQLLPSYRIGLDAMDAEAVAAYGRHFADLYPVRQDALISNLERGITDTLWVIPAIGFMTLLINHAAEGYYSEPAQGGNHDKKSWEMIGFDQAVKP